MSCGHHFVDSLRKEYGLCTVCGTARSKSAEDPYVIYSDDYYSPKHNRSTIEEQVYNVEVHKEHGITKNDFVIDRLKPPGFNGVLEIGCAPGSLLKRMRVFGFDRIVGIEVDQRYEPNIRSICGDGPELLFGFFPGITEETFDKPKFSAVIALDIWEHFFDPKDALMECNRIMVPGAQLFLMLPLLLPGVGLDDRFFVPSEHVYLHSEAHIRELVEEAGFGSIKLDEWTNGHNSVSAIKL